MSPGEGARWIELRLDVEPAGWGRLVIGDGLLTITLRVSYLSDLISDVVGVIARVAGGAESAATALGVEPGSAMLSVECQDGVFSVISLQVDGQRRGACTYQFQIATKSLGRLGLDLVASVDRDEYLTSWAPVATWPDDLIARLRASLVNEPPNSR